jgi:hypothetical protein
VWGIVRGIVRGGVRGDRLLQTTGGHGNLIDSARVSLTDSHPRR